MTSLPLPNTPQPIAPHADAPLLWQTDGVARLTLNRPAEHNRIDPADVDALQPLLDRLAGESIERRPRILVITGTGERSFSSGYTLQSIVGELDSRFERMLDTIEALPFVTVAAFNGSVYGGATDLALCCDLRIGTPGLRMFMPAAKFGLHYYPGGLRRYVSRLGLAAASKLMLTGVTIESDEMLRIGFLSEIVERSALEARIDAIVEQVLQTEPNVVAQMKAHMLALARPGASSDEARVLEDAMARATETSLRSQALKDRLATRLKR